MTVSSLTQLLAKSPHSDDAGSGRHTMVNLGHTLTMSPPAMDVLLDAFADICKSGNSGSIPKSAVGGLNSETVRSGMVALLQVVGSGAASVSHLKR